MRRKLKRGQSILEYTLLLGVVIGVVVLAIFGVGGVGGVKEQVNQTYNKTIEALNKTITDIDHGIYSNSTGGT